MAYAALISLSQILDKLDDFDDYFRVYPKARKVLNSLSNDICTILAFLELHSHRNQLNLRFQSRIIDAAYEAGDVIESNMSDFLQPLGESKPIEWPILFGLFSITKVAFDTLVNPVGALLRPLTAESLTANRLIYAMKELKCVSKEMSKFMVSEEKKTKSSAPHVATFTTNTLVVYDTNMMVGFDDDFIEIKNQIFQESSNLEIISIVGMGGIGKSTLARKIYEDSIRMLHFDRHAWIVVSQNKSFQDILMGLLRFMNISTDTIATENDCGLRTQVHKELIGRRYLIVVDDVWSNEVCDNLRAILPKENNGSRVLITTRHLDVANHVRSPSTPPRELRCLNEAESWSLFKKKVFRDEPCPPSLVQVGAKVVKKCGGLPLKIIVAAGVLKDNKTAEYWESVNLQPCSGVLSLSYDCLQMYLKPCFLYMTLFPGGEEINVTRLIRLWVAEGFIKPSGLKCMEEVAEGYLEDLVDKSLLLVSERRYNGRIKSVRIHDELREIGTSKALEERFHYGGLPERIKTRQPQWLTNWTRNSKEGKQRRLTIDTRSALDCLENIDDIMVRSLVISFHGYVDNSSPITKFKLLGILDAQNTHLTFDFRSLLHLRYLAFKYDQPELSEVFKLRYLETLIIHGGRTREVSDGLLIPSIIWKIYSLRHLIFPEQCYVEQPSEHEMATETDLQTLSLATNLEISTQIIKMLAKLRKLGLFYFGVNEGEWNRFQFSNISYLQNLQELKIIFHRGHKWWPDCLPVELAFPLSLKKLTLENIHRPWEDMNIVGALPNLEVLKLRRMACPCKEWNPVEGQFKRLKYLKLEQVYLKRWKADCEHFPVLEFLVLDSMGNFQAPLKEIPEGLGEIDTLKLIRLQICEQRLVESAKQIQANQRDLGNDDIQLLIFN